MKSWAVALWIVVLAAGWLAQGLLIDGRLSAGLLVYLAAGAGLLALVRPTNNDVHATPSEGANAILFDLSIPLALAAVVIGTLASAFSGLGVIYGPGWYWAAFLFWIAFLILCLAASFKHVYGALSELKQQPWAPPVILAIIALTLGLFKLTNIPATVHGDEGMVGLHARMVLEGRIETLFSSSWYSIPQFFFAVPAMVMSLCGDNLFGLRFTSTLLGVAVVLMTYQTARSYWGWRPAFAAALLLASNQWFLFLMHSGVQYIQASFFAIGALLIWNRMNQRRSAALCALAGVWLGLAMQSYQANHILPALWVASQICLFVWRRIGARWLACSTLIPVVFMVLTLGPLAAHDFCKISRLDFLSSRVQSILIWNQPDEISNPSHQWRTQFERALLAPVLYLDQSAQFGGDAPLLDRASAALFMLAVIAALLRFYDPRWGAPLLWILAILIAGAAMVMDAPFYPRLAGITPLLFLLIAGLLHEIDNASSRSKAKWLLPVVSCVLIATSITTNLHEFFGRYAHETSPRSIHYPQTQFAYWMKQLPSGTQVFVFDGPHCSAFSGTAQFIAKDVDAKNINSIDMISALQQSAIVIDPTRKQLLPEIQNRLNGGKVTLHRNRFGDLMFYTVSL